MTSATFIVGHLGLARNRPGLELYDGNDPYDDRVRPLVVTDPTLERREGATAILIVLPGRFSSNDLLTAILSEIGPLIQAALH